MGDHDAVIAACRFGLGARPGELDAKDPRAGLLAQLAPTVPMPAVFAGLPTAGAVVAEVDLARDDKAQEKVIRKKHDALLDQEAALRTQVQVTSTQPFRERLVAFWSNHFSIGTGKDLMNGLVGAFEREAIRPHVCGKFVDLLRASTQHPGMLHYLDQWRSTGPNSKVGLKGDKGLNENFAREVMELHTLGVDGGYSQADVQELAKILTGWTLSPPSRGGNGEYLFDPRRHEPGSKTLLGKTYVDSGESEGLDALATLAAHPATARHLARKLAVHFVADNPPNWLVDRLADTYVATDGDLSAVAKALVTSPDAWKPEAVKIKTPFELVISAGRAAGVTDGAALVKAMKAMGQMPWSAPSPAGFGDVATAWTGPQAVLERIEFAQRAGDRSADAVADPVHLARQVLGPWLQPDTIAAIDGASHRGRALALLFVSPEFQRR